MSGMRLVKLVALSCIFHGVVECMNFAKPERAEYVVGGMVSLWNNPYTISAVHESGSHTRTRGLPEERTTVWTVTAERPMHFCCVRLTHVVRFTSVLRRNYMNPVGLNSERTTSDWSDSYRLGR